MRFTRFLTAAASLVAGLVILSGMAEAALGKRVALVVGNSDYTHAVQLPNPERDAKAIADKLRKLGFVVVEGYNLSHEGMKDTVKDFSMAVRGAEIGLFFYAGHGMQVNGQNYLIPVDAEFKDISALDFEAIPIDLVNKQMQFDVGVRLLVLDACRDNPLAKTLARSMAGATRSSSISEGLAEVKITDAGEGTAVIFATSPDEVALDGDGNHSPFTTALLDNIDAPDTDLQVVMSRVTGAVYASTKQQQRPWINASLTGDVFLNPQAETSNAAATTPVASEPAPSAPGNSLERETALYNLARESGAREDYQAYLETFPQGLFAANARKQLEKLDAGVTPPQQQAALAPAPATSEPTRNLPAQPQIELPVTETVKAMSATADTEKQLELDRDKRAEIQTRLTLAGFLKGSADGSFGAKSRTAIGSWQVSRGLTQSGYFNQPQYEIFMQQTNAAYAAYVPEAPQATSPTGKNGATAKNSSRNKVASKQSQKRQKNNRRRSGGAEEFGRFVGGVVRGVLNH